MNNYKLCFIENEFLCLIKTLSENTMGKWGKMNAQQMMEHVSDFFKVSTNQMQFSLVTAPENLLKYKAFLMSEKEFRENTQAPVLPEQPMPIRFSTMQESIEELEREIKLFIKKFSSGEITSSQHPVFGDLNFKEWVQLHHKHLVHHAKQFGLL